MKLEQLVTNELVRYYESLSDWEKIKLDRMYRKTKKHLWYQRVKPVLIKNGSYVKDLREDSDSV